MLNLSHRCLRFWNKISNFLETSKSWSIVVRETKMRTNLKHNNLSSIKKPNGYLEANGQQIYTENPKTKKKQRRLFISRKNFKQVLCKNR